MKDVALALLLSLLLLGLLLGKIVATVKRPPAPPTRTIYVNTNPFLLQVQCSKCGTLTTVVTNIP